VDVVLLVYAALIPYMYMCDLLSATLVQDKSWGSDVDALTSVTRESGGHSGIPIASVPSRFVGVHVH
jgi:hypothetical protein